MILRAIAYSPIHRPTSSKTQRGKFQGRKKPHTNTKCVELTILLYTNWLIQSLSPNNSGKFWYGDYKVDTALHWIRVGWAIIELYIYQRAVKIAFGELVL